MQSTERKNLGGMRFAIAKVDFEWQDSAQVTVRRLDRFAALLGEMSESA